MKKLVAMLLAVAGTLGLWADTVPHMSGGNFQDEHFVVGSEFVTGHDETNGVSDTSFWFTKDTDDFEGTIASDDEGATKYLDFESNITNPVYRTIFNSKGDQYTDPSAFGTNSIGLGLFIDTQVKFTPYTVTDVHTAPEGNAGDKLIVWLREKEVEVSAGVTNMVTNLVATASYFKDDQNTREVKHYELNYSGSYAALVNSFNRLTIKALVMKEDGESVFVGFVVYLNENVLTYNDNAGIDGSVMTTLSGTAAKYYNSERHALLPSLAAPLAANAAIAAVGFSGTGAVKQNYFDNYGTDYPEFAADMVEFQVQWSEGVASFSCLGKDIVTDGTAGSTNLTVLPSASTFEISNVTYANGYYGQANTWYDQKKNKINNTTTGATVTINGSAWYMIDAFQDNFDVGGTKFKYLMPTDWDPAGGAYNYLKSNGGTLKLLNNATINSTMTFTSDDHAVIIDLAGKTLQNTTGESTIFNNGGTLVITNSTVEIGQLLKAETYALTVYGGSTKIYGGIIEQVNDSDGDGFEIYGGTYTQNYRSQTGAFTLAGYVADGYTYRKGEGNSFTVYPARSITFTWDGTIDSVSFTSNGVELAVTKDAELGNFVDGDVIGATVTAAAGYTYTGATSWTVDAELSAINVSCSGVAAFTLTVPDLTDANVSCAVTTGSVELATASSYTIVQGTEVSVTWTALNNYLFANGATTTNEVFTMNAAKTLTIPAVAPAKAAKGTVIYLTLQEALDSAETGDVKLFADAEGGFTLSQAVTIDLNGYSLNFTGSEVAQNVTIKGTGALAYDGTLTVSAILDLSNIAYAQTVPGCKGGFDITSTGKVIFPNGVTGDPTAVASAIAASVQGSKVVINGTTYTKYADGWSTAAAAVAQIGENNYSTLNAALDAVAAEGKITLLADVEVADLTHITKDNIEIDLAGNSMTLVDAAMSLANSIKITSSTTVEGKGLKNLAQITIAEGKTLDLSTLGWGAGLLDAGQVTPTATITLAKDASYKQSQQPVWDDALTNIFAAVEGYNITLAKADDIATISVEAATPAVPWAGSGTSESPYEIATYADLVALQTWVADGKETAGVYFEQTANIDFADIDGDGTAAVAWTGIGSDTYKFAGSYNGGGFALNNFTLVEADKVGMFNCIDSTAVISDLVIDINWVSTSDSCAGAALVGKAYGGTINRVKVTGTIDLADQAGGIVYRAYNNAPTTLTFNNCTNAANIEIDGAKLGAMLHARDSYVTCTVVFNGCVNTGKLKSTKTIDKTSTADPIGCVGGILGWGGYGGGSITINNCVSTGTIDAPNCWAATLVGQGGKSFTGTNIGLDNLRALGGRTANDDAINFAIVDTPVAGQVTYTNVPASVTGTVAYKVIQPNSKAFTLDAAAASLTIVTNFMPWTGTASSGVTGYDIVETPSATGVTFTLEAQKFTVTFDPNNGSAVIVSNNVPYNTAFANVKPADPANAPYIFAGWTPVEAAITSNTTYTAAWSYAHPTGFPREGSSEGQLGTAEHPYELASADDFAAFKTAVEDGTAGTYVFKVTGDSISLSEWVGVGTSKSAAFKGTLEGNGKTITVQFKGGYDYNGLIRYANGATIRNLTVNSLGFDSTPSGVKTGAACFVGKGYNVTLTGLLATGTIGTSSARGNHNAAGIAVAIYGGGKDMTATLFACTNRAAVYTKYTKAGGIIAMINSSDTSGLVTVERCSNEGRVDNDTTSGDNNYTGGIVGWDGYGGPVAYTDCRNTAVVVSSMAGHAGSLFGQRQASGTGSGVFGTWSSTATNVTTACGGENDSVLRWATVSGDVATFVTPSTTIGDESVEYKLMLKSLNTAFTLGNVNSSLTILTNLYAYTGAVTTDVTGYEVVETPSATGVTFTLAPTSYTITYKEADGTEFTRWASAYTAPTSYTITDAVTLPVAADVDLGEGATFEGWTNATGTVVAGWEAGATGNVEVFLKSSVVADEWHTPASDGKAVTDSLETDGFGGEVTNQITTVEVFNAFKAYVGTVTSGKTPVTLTANEKANAYICYQLNAEAIPDAAITSEDVEIKSLTLNSGAMAVSVKIDGVTPGAGVTTAQIEAVLTAKGSDDLGTMTTDKVTVTGVGTADGKVNITVTPKASSPTKFFTQVILKK